MTGSTDVLREAIFSTYESLAESIGRLSDLLGAFVELGKAGVVPDKKLLQGAERVVTDTNRQIAEVMELIRKGREG